MEQENDSSLFSPKIESTKNPFLFVEHKGMKKVIGTSGYESDTSSSGDSNEIDHSSAVRFYSIHSADTSALLPSNWSRGRTNLDNGEEGCGSPQGGSPLAQDETESQFKFDGSNSSRNPSLPIKLDRKDKEKLQQHDKKVSERSPSLPRKTTKESFKAMKESYRREQKRRIKELSSALKDPSVIILSSWLKVRGTLKGWQKFWCVVKPGMLLIYKSAKHGQWVGTVLLNGCEILQRPSKKEGFCFKIYHPLEHYMWATKGPKGELAGSIAQPMPKDHLILRADSESDGKCWLDALEVAQNQGYSIQKDNKGMLSELYGKDDKEDQDDEQGIPDQDEDSNDAMEKSDSENELDDTIGPLGREGEDEIDEGPIIETSYLKEKGEEYLGQAGEALEEIEDENKSILWALLKQVKPGMDLSRVTLPTFILEPRSFLDKLSDFYFHSDILSRAAREENAYNRMKEVVRWYLSGFYKKPKGLKKPYNPILGETFRCFWLHPNGTRSHFVAEQVSHHPPVSAFYVSNREEGYVVNCSCLAKSKFYGNSSSAILDGSATMTLLRFGEEYVMSLPYAHCKGILIGTLTMELGGVVTINCEKTGYKAEIEFKLKPFWKKSGESNFVSGKIKMGKETLCRIEGKWDGEVIIVDLKAPVPAGEAEPLPELFWEPTPEIRQQRLPRYIVDYTSQGEFESEKLWIHVSDAIKVNDQEKATQEKFVLEEAQRKGHRERREKGEDWVPKLFERDPAAPNAINRWVYKYRDVRPWDPMTDLKEYEKEGIIKTQYRLKAPMVRTTSLLSVQTPDLNKKSSSKRKRPSSGRLQSSGSGQAKGSRRNSMDRSGASTPDPDADHSSSVEDDDDSSFKETIDTATLEKILQPLKDLQKECVQQMRAIRSDLRRHYTSHQDDIASLQFKDWLLLLLFIISQGFFHWYYKT
ncbi:oxysterol-binding protein-related protein 8-like isoform X2 [Acropora millepora]|uniref:oxysterol-binding protein-related protein 8-like isoform X2 n=1 Tax=Acropora millepora TaxID=45264 RepID=UPI001CF1A331|nr:oxysterol-binding protein-related protein 8-like isoform X2 [Acropora millepora]